MLVYSISLKNRLGQSIHGAGVHKLALPDARPTGSLPVEFEPHEERALVGTPRDAVTNQMWNLIERGHVILRVGNKRIIDRSKSWPGGAEYVAPPSFPSAPVVSQTGDGYAIAATPAGDGTLYAVALPEGSTPPTGPDVAAGTDGDGIPAVGSGSVPLADGIETTLDLGGLGPDPHDVYVVTENGTGNVTDPISYPPESQTPVTTNAIITDSGEDVITDGGEVLVYE